MKIILKERISFTAISFSLEYAQVSRGRAFDPSSNSARCFNGKLKPYFVFIIENILHDVFPLF